MALILYLGFLGLSGAYALHDWRRAWLCVLICAVVQDPVRKLTPGQPVAVSFLVVGLFGVILIAARQELFAAAADFGQRFPRLNTTLVVFLLVLLVAALNGLATYGIALWKVPLVSFVTYVAPISAVLLGYAWLQREEALFQFLRAYAVLTSMALLGSLLEYARVTSPVLGAVSLVGDNIRHLPGIQLRMLSGFYRSPDIMALHAALLTTVALIMAVRSGVRRQVLFWYAAGGLGFLVCILSSRRKALYFIAVGTVIFLWRYVKRLSGSQVFAIVAVTALLGGVLNSISSNEETSIYIRGAAASQQEFAQRLEGGTMETFRQFGFMGAGLGTATQGVRHLLGTSTNIGWQEGGLAKLAIEVGLPGMGTVVVLMWIVFRLWLRLTSIGDVPGCSQFVRVLLFALAVATGASYIASAQTYSDAVLALVGGFLVGCLFATATLDERVAAAADPVPRDEGRPAGASLPATT